MTYPLLFEELERVSKTIRDLDVMYRRMSRIGFPPERRGDAERLILQLKNLMEMTVQESESARERHNEITIQWKKDWKVE